MEEVKAAAAKGGFDIEGLEILDPATYPEIDKMVDTMVELRKGKMSAEDCRAALSKGNYFGTMLVKMGVADALLGGATYSTADTVRPALQLVKTKKGANLVSSCFIMVRGEEMLAMGDCAINISYEDKLDKEGNVTLTAAAQLAEVAVETAKTAKVFGIEPKVAMLSYSTKGSGKGPSVDLVREATAIAKEMAPDVAIDGEMQFDRRRLPGGGPAEVPRQQGGRLRQHLHLPGDTVRQHRLQNSPAAWADLPLTAPSSRASTPPSTTCPGAATPRKSTRCPSSLPPWHKS